MIRIRIDEEKGSFLAEGHAGHGEKGKDIVCAAVSCLAEMLGNAALRKGGSAEDDGDEVRIRGWGFAYTVGLRAVTDELAML